MTLTRHRFAYLAGAASALMVVAMAVIALSGQDAWSQAARTIKLVVPYPPGGGIDVTARLLAEQIGRMQGPTVVIENRPGGGTLIGSEAVARAAPDGNTVLIATNTFVITPQLRKANYDPLLGFEPICEIVNTPTIFAVNDASPYRTLGDLINAARARPAELTLASVPGTFLHVTFEMLRQAANVDMSFIPYPGTAPSVGALLGGHVASVHVDYPAVAEQLKSGKVRALATGSRRRTQELPNVPTVDESGFAGYEAELWYGLFAPAKTPKDMIAQLAGWFTTALQAAEIKPKLAAQGLHPAPMCGADFGAYVRKQYDDYGRVIREGNIKAE